MKKYPKCLTNCNRKPYKVMLSEESVEVEIFPCDYMIFSTDNKLDHDILKKRNLHLSDLRSCEEIDRELKEHILEPVRLPARICDSVKAETDLHNLPKGKYLESFELAHSGQFHSLSNNKHNSQ